MQETQARSLGQEYPLEKGMATHSSILAWRIPWTEEPDELQFMGLQIVRHDWVTNTILFSKVAAPIYIPTNSVEEFLFLHTLSSICYL